MKYKKSRTNSLAHEEFLGATIDGHFVSPRQANVVGVMLAVVVGDEPLMGAIAKIVLEDNICLGRPMHRFASLNRVFDLL